MPDRGPFDGRTDVPYLDRFHFFHVKLRPGGGVPQHHGHAARHPVPQGAPATRASSATRTPSRRTISRRRASIPRACAWAPMATSSCRTSTGPTSASSTVRVTSSRRIAVPAKFLLDPVVGMQSGDINNPIDAASLELAPVNNTFGRQANRGMEGLAITPDGKMLVGIMQNALIQDNGLNVVLDLNTVPGRRGLNNRILTVDLETGETHEYVYTDGCDQPGPRRQRDPRDQQPRVPGPRARQPHAVSADPADRAEPEAHLPDRPEQERAAGRDRRVRRARACRRRAPTSRRWTSRRCRRRSSSTCSKDVYKVNATHTIKDVIAEKMEALAWGPDLPDGRHVLYVLSDNDLNPDLADADLRLRDGRRAGRHHLRAAAASGADVPARTGQEGAEVTARDGARV